MGIVTEDLSQSQMYFKLKEGDADQFHVMRYRGTEGLCQLYRFEIEVVSVDDAALTQDIVGRAAVLGLGDGAAWFHGLVSRFEMTGEGVDQTYYRIELVPPLWLLTHRSNSASFRDMTTADIIQHVFDESGIVGHYPFEVEAVPSSKTREFTVQYRETDYTFICRLLEDEGIRWWFENTESGCKLRFSDAPTYEPIEGDGPEVQYTQPSQMSSGDAEFVSHFRLSRSVRTGSVALTDYNYTNPQLDLAAKSEGERDKGLQFFDYPGAYAAQDEGSKLAEIRRDEFESGRVVGVGLSNCARLHPGRKFKLSGHSAEGADGEYMITSVTHQGKQATTQTTTGTNGRGNVLGASLYQSLLTARSNQDRTTTDMADALLRLAERMSAGDPTANRALTNWLYHAGQVARDPLLAAVVQGGKPAETLSLPNLLDDVPGANQMNFDAPVYSCRFECIPGAVPYRPARVTPWPQMRGSQTAIVVGSGEIDSDSCGRVKVKFFWDRGPSKDYSCWIRFSNGWAGGGYGMMFVPRVGQEVIVDFLEGNPDKPIITGRVYNNDNMPAYPLPDEQTKSYIKTNSSTGGGGTNEIRFEDLKGSEQVLINAQKDFHIRVGKDEGEERHNVKDNQHLIVGGEQREKISGHRSITVESADALSVGGKQSVVVKEDAFHEFKANLDHAVASEYHIKADKIVVEASSGISLKNGSNFVLIDASGVTIVGSQVKLNSGGSPLSSSITGSPPSPAEPEEADEVEPGEDTTFSPDAGVAPPAEADPHKGQWISIELKDPDGNPVAGEYFEITTPSGKVLEGTLDVNGYKRVWVDEEGECQISFPRLDAEEWHPA